MENSLYDQCLKFARPGVIEEHHENTAAEGSPRIILAGDMHMLPAIQRNIARFIIQLYRNVPGMKTVTCESDTGYIYTGGFLQKGTAPAEQVEKGLQQKILKGHEAASVLLEERIEILGIENPLLYNKAKQSMDSLMFLSSDLNRFRSLSVSLFGSDVLSRNSMAFTSPENIPVKTLSALLRMMNLQASEDDYTHILFDEKISTYESFCEKFQEHFAMRGYEGDLRTERYIERLFSSAACFYTTAAERDEHYVKELLILGSRLYPAPVVFVVGDIHTKRIFGMLRSGCSEILYWHPRPGWDGDLGSLPV